MTYSLVSMPVLGFDLCRLPRGPEVAAILLAALGLDGGTLAAVAAQHPGPAHELRWEQVRRSGGPRPAVVSELRAVQAAAPSLTQARTLVEALERSLIGDLDALVRLVRDDILDWTWLGTDTSRVQDPVAAAAVEVIAEALAAGYCSEVLPAGLADVLTRPWTAAGVPGDQLDLGPFAPTVRGLIDRIAALDAPSRERLRAEIGHRPGSPAWARAAHDASWAVYLTGRLRAAAAAQLLTVQAFRSAGFTALDGAHGMWNLVSGVVQSVVVGDLVDREVADTLRGDWIRIVGEF